MKERVGAGACPIQCLSEVELARPDEGIWAYM